MKNGTNQTFWEMFYIRGFNNKELMLSEAVRTVKTYRYVRNNDIRVSDSREDKEQLFQVMKKTSLENGLGHFPGDRDFFYQLFLLAEGLDLLGLLVDAYKNDRTGIVLAPDYLVNFLSEIVSGGVNSVMVAEAEKLAAGLQILIRANPDKRFTLTTERYTVFHLLKTVFGEFENVEVLNQSIYRDLLITGGFDLVLGIPAFGGRLSPEETSASFMTRELESIAIENLLKRINDDGRLTAIVPAKLTFAGGQMQRFREWILENFGVASIYSLPEGIFRPHTGIKTYLMTFTKRKTDSVVLGVLKADNNNLKVTQRHNVSLAEFARHDDWRVDLFTASDNEEIRRFRASGIKKVKLKEIAEIFRGKSVLKDDIKPGKVFILNISNIGDGEVLLDHMETIDEEERKVRRYQLEKNDILLTCRGTVNKVALFPETRRMVIASANIIVVRVRARVLPLYLKLFLESPLGQMLVKSFQRGTNVMNINPNDIGELEVPLLSMDRQRELAGKYADALKQYKSEREAIEKRWERQRTEIYQGLLGQEVL